MPAMRRPPRTAGDRARGRHSADGARGRTSADRALGRWLQHNGAGPPALGAYASTPLLRSPQGRPIELHVFPGRSTDTALVIGGVHGTECIGVDVVRRLITKLQTERGTSKRAYFTTIVVPALFPDNLPGSHGGAGKARRATRNRADPNRQFPAIGTDLGARLSDFADNYTGAAAHTVIRDARGRPIERANLALLALIRRCRPRRIASVHAIQAPSLAGIYSDPLPNAGAELAAEAAAIAQRIHAITKRGRGHVPGFGLSGPSYPKQDEVDGEGVSLGAWASRPSASASHRREPMPVITVELKRDWHSSEARRRARNIEAFMLGIRYGFLEV